MLRGRNPDVLTCIANLSNDEVFTPPEFANRMLDTLAEADANFVLTGSGDIVEIQATGEKRGFSQAEFEALFGLARKGIAELVVMQRAAVGR